MKITFFSLLTFALGWLAGGSGIVPGWFADKKTEQEANAASRPAKLKAASTATPITSGDAFGKGPSSTQSDPFARWETALKAGKLTDPKLRRALMGEMVATDPVRAWKLLMAGDVPVQVADIEALAQVWCEKDGQAAARFGLTIQDEYSRSIFLRRAVTAWLLEKPGECLAWIKQQPEQLDLPRYLRIQDWGYSMDNFTLPDLDALIAIHPATDRFPSIVGASFKAALRSGIPSTEALSWLRRQPASDVRDAAWQSYIEHLAEKGDWRAAASFVNEIADAPFRRHASSEVAAQMAGDDPRAAMAYAATLTEPYASKVAWQSAFASWAAQKPDEALAYANENIQQLTPELLNASTSQWAKARPAETLALAARFTDSPARTSFISSIVNQWQGDNATQARAWLQSPTAASLLSAADLQRQLGQFNAVTAPGTHSSTTTINGRKVSYSY